MIGIEKLKKLIDPSLITPGWREMPTETYHADKTAVNFSSLKHIEKSSHAFARSYWGKSKEKTDAMRFGSIAHLAILEGSKFKELVVVMPEFESRTAAGIKTDSKNTTYYKMQVEEWKAAQNKKAVIVSHDDMERILNMIESVMSNEAAVNLIKRGKPEVIGYWNDPKTGINLRLAGDLLSFDVEVLTDLKTCQDSRWELFRKNVEAHRYDLQMAMYREGIFHITGIRPQHGAWLAVESKEPYETRIHEVGAKYEAIGDFEFRRSIDKLKKSIDEESFSHGKEEIMIGEPTVWFERKYIELGVLNNE